MEKNDFLQFLFQCLVSLSRSNRTWCHLLYFWSSWYSLNKIPSVEPDTEIKKKLRNRGVLIIFSMTVWRSGPVTIVSRRVLKVIDAVKLLYLVQCVNERDSAELMWQICTTVFTSAVRNIIYCDTITKNIIWKVIFSVCAKLSITIWSIKKQTVQADTKDLFQTLIKKHCEL